MNAVFYIAKRYLISKSSRNVINIINWITALVVVIGGVSLFVVLSGFSGLKTFSLSFSSLFDPDMKILPKEGKYFTIDKEQHQKLSNIKEIVAFSEEVEERVFLNHNQKNHIAYIKGVDENYPNVNAVDSVMAIGNWDLNNGRVVVGGGIANGLSLGIFDTSSPLQIIVPKEGKGSITSNTKPYRETLTIVSGIYQITEELDKKYVFSSIEEARHLLGLKENEVSGIELRLARGTNEAKVQEQIQKIWGNAVIIKNRTQLNDALYRMLNTENIAVYLIFTLVLIIALFNLVGAIIMMILDKKDNLRTLYSIGFSVSQLKQIFFTQGILISFFGSLSGVLVGILIVAFQKYFHWVMISPNLPYPVEIRWENCLIVFFTILLLGSIASKIASTRVNYKLLER